MVPQKMMETPGVLAFLNGCDLRSALRGQVLLAKMFGTILAVGGGLALGPEGWGDETKLGGWGSCWKFKHMEKNKQIVR